MAGTIQEYATERGINCLMHFTRASNLESILRRGLAPRDTLNPEGYNNLGLGLSNAHFLGPPIDVSQF